MIDLKLGAYVTIRFHRLSPSSLFDMDGFPIAYGCTGRDSSEPRCENSAVLLMTSNFQQRAACTDHIAVALNELLDDALRRKNGETPSGFLHRPDPVNERFVRAGAGEETNDLVWQNRLDQRYDVVVFRAKEAYKGVLIIRDGDTELERLRVGLSYNAVVGPDSADVQAWSDAAIAVVDQRKSAAQRLDEAIERLEQQRRARIKKLQSSPRTDEAFRLALNVFKSPETSIEWLIAPSVGLKHSAPADVLANDDGPGQIVQALDDVVRTVYPLS